MKILIIEDNDVIRDELALFLKKYDYEVAALTQFDKVMEDIEREVPDLILLDINLPMFDGFHICRELRRKSDIPIIIVTSRDTEVDELMSMNLGADDFVTKPYNTQILLARIASILKRTRGLTAKAQDSLVYGELKLNLLSGTIVCKDKELELTKNELKILSYMIRKQGSIVSREDLIDHLWSSNLFVDDNNLSVNVARLRKKLEEIGVQNSIETRRGLGYILP